MSYPRPILKRSTSSSNSVDPGTGSISSDSSYSTASSNSTAPSSYSYTSPSAYSGAHAQPQTTPTTRTRKLSVHFPDHHSSGSPVSHTHYTHSKLTYDRTPIQVDRNECRMPKRGTRMYLNGEKIRRDSGRGEREGEWLRETREDMDGEGKKRIRREDEREDGSYEQEEYAYGDEDTADRHDLSSAFNAMSIQPHNSKERDEYPYAEYGYERTNGYSHRRHYYHPNLDSFVANLDHLPPTKANAKESKSAYKSYGSGANMGCLDGF